MKFSCILALAAAANAQYFSEGWTPGQSVTAEKAAPTFVGVPNPNARQQQAPDFSLSSLFDINNILNSNTVKGLFEKAGINITERLEAAAVSPWDMRIPLITDENYFDIIVNETLTEEEEERRTWVLVVSAGATKSEGISKFVDDVFDDTYNQTVLAGDLPHIRFGRLDYLNVTYITTKWNLWNAPAIVILRDRGQTLRFYRPSQLRISNGALREFIKQDGWLVSPPWSSAFAPGGKREFVLEFFAIWMAKWYKLTVKVPRWILILISGTVASFAVNLFHGWTSGPPPKPTVVRRPAGAGAAGAPAAAAASSSATAAAAAPASPSKSGAKQRKGKGKK